MRESFLCAFAVLKKEFLQLKRDKTTLVMMIAIPIMQLMLFGYAINSDPRQLPTAIINQDPSPISRTLISALKNSSYFEMTYAPKNEKEGKKLLQKGLVTFLITIPQNFYKNFVKGNKPYILVECDATDPVAIAGPSGALPEIIMRAVNQETKGALDNLKIAKPSIDVRLHKMYNPEGLSRYNIIQGLIAIVLMMTCVTMTALSLTREREQGTMENLLSMPAKPFEIMIGKITPYIMIAYTQAFIIIFSAHFLFGLPILGSFLLLVLGLFVFIACKLSIGFTISAAATNQAQAMQMSMFLILPSILLSGFMFPFNGMPQWARALGSIIPSTYFIRIMRSIMLKGCVVGQIWIHIWPLLLFTCLTMAFATKIYKKTLD